jgi:hypothetical protein
MKKFLICALLAIGILGLVGAGTVSARGWFGGCADLDPETMIEKQNQMFEKKAEFFGISVDQIKEYWIQGKNMNEILEELGINKEEFWEQMKQSKQERMQEHLQIMVENGAITQEQADQRLEAMNNHFENGEMGKGFHKGFGGNFGLKNNGLK